jgi:hypothetical protein
VGTEDYRWHWSHRENIDVGYVAYKAQRKGKLGGKQAVTSDECTEEERPLYLESNDNTSNNDTIDSNSNNTSDDGNRMNEIFL